MLIEGLIIKAAFVVQAERMTYIHGSKYAPTIRVSVRLHPRMTVPKFSVAVSEIKKDGTIFRPMIVWKSR